MERNVAASVRVHNQHHLWNDEDVAFGSRLLITF